jgi:amino acid adenylation domain-containing protein
MMCNTIQNQIGKSIESFSSRVAIEYGNKKITYEELGKQSRGIANILTKHRVSKDAHIGVLSFDKYNLILSIIGILKARMVFVPIDPLYPIQRIKGMMEVSDIEILLVDDSIKTEILNSIADICRNIKIINIDNELSKIDLSSIAEVNIEYKPEDKIYIYFTSGSTGKPKAILGKNMGLLHFLMWEIRTFNINQDVRVSQFTSQCHDPFLRDIFIPILVGGTACIPQHKEEILSSVSLTNWVENSKVNLIHCTPSLFRILNGSALSSDNFKQLQYVLLAGERVLPGELANWYRIFGSRIQLVNMYGPSETTLAKVFYLIAQSDVNRNSIPIGKPIDGCEVFIVDKVLKSCSQGEMGEILIHTPYRTLGYYGDVEMTAQKFIPNLFSDDKNDLVYKTGDLGRLLNDGNIEFLGRMDRQIKIRGFRVELQEIENEILKYPGIHECVVDAREMSSNLNDNQKYSDMYLAAYYTAVNVLPEAGLREHLERKLPDYMIPAYFVHMDKIPLTPNGKIDYKILPNPKKVAIINYVAPRDYIEKELEKIWCEILGVDKVGIDRDFLKIGGNSLNVMTLIAKVYRQFDVEIPIREIFYKPTVEGVAGYIKKHSKVQQV